MTQQAVNRQPEDAANRHQKVPHQNTAGAPTCDVVGEQHTAQVVETAPSLIP